MVAGGLILFLLGAGVGLNQAQLPPATMELREWERDLPAQGEGSDSGVTLNLGAHGRYSFPFGQVDRNAFVYNAGVVVIDRSVSWADLFHAGWGFDVELDLYFTGRGLTSPKGDLSAGLAFLFERSDFGGASVSDSSGGNVKFGSLDTTGLLLGGVVLQPLGHGAYTKGVLAAGAVRYSSVNATFSGPGPTQFSDEVFQSTWTIAGDLRALIGYRFGSLGVNFGIGLRIQAPPSESSRVSINSGAFWVFDLNFGLDLGF